MNATIFHRSVLAALALVLVAAPVVAQDAVDAGDYTVGLYADPTGASHEVRIGDDDDSFTVYLGLTGDPVTVLSGAAFSLRLSEFLEPGGPILWERIDGLEEKENFFDEDFGGQVIFTSCRTQPDDGPLMIGKFDVDVDPRFREGTVSVDPHEYAGLQVQLCMGDGTWPKRNAEPLHLRVVRGQSWWSRLTSWFD